MTSLLRTGTIETFSRAAYNSSQPNPVKLKHASKTLKDHCVLPLTSESMKVRRTSLFQPVNFVASLTKSSQIRFFHNDNVFPNMEEYRKNSTRDPTKRMEETEEPRKLVPYMAYGFGGVLGLYAAKTIVLDLVAYKSPPKSQLALAAIEINLNDIPEGKSATFMWRGKPVFVRHRTQEQIEKERSVPVNELRDPQADEARAISKPEWLVVIGVCTHLGCVPIANQGEFGGYYCPCHGSHYDTAGRIRKGPAPLNLEIPEHEFTNDNRLIVGKI